MYPTLIKKEMGKKPKHFELWSKFMYVSLYVVDDDSEGWVLLAWITFFSRKRKKSTIK